MPKFILIPFTVLITSSFMVAGCGKHVPSGDVIANYDGGKVTSTELQTALEKLPERVRAVALRQKPEFMESFITEKLLLQEAESQGLQHIAEVKDLVRQARDRILVAKLVEEEVDSKSIASDEDALAYYESHREEFTTPYRLKASHILLRSREEAESILDQIQLGDSFEELAKEHSLDPTAVKGGDIGYFQKDQLIPEIEEAAFMLKKGQISDVIQSPFGFHIVKVTGEAKPQVKEFELVAKEIKEKIVIQKKAEHFNALTDRLKEKANVSVNEETLEKFEYHTQGNSSEENPADS